MSAPFVANNTTSAFRPLDTTSVLRPSNMACPECARSSEHPGKLIKLAAGKTDFQHCGACGGVWFQDREVDIALRATAARVWPEPASAPIVNKVGTAPQAWSCPCCHGTLVEIHDRSGSGATVHRCLVCYGGWIQYSDLVIAAKAYTALLAWLGRSIRMLWAS